MSSPHISGIPVKVVEPLRQPFVHMVVLLLPLQVLHQKLVLLVTHVDHIPQLILHLLLPPVLLTDHLHLAVYLGNVVVLRTVVLLPTICGYRISQVIRIGFPQRALLHLHTGLLHYAVQLETGRVLLMAFAYSRLLLSVAFALLYLMDLSVSKLSLENVRVGVAG